MTTSKPPAPPAGPAGPCPDAETLAGLAIGDTEGVDRRAVADHVATCPSCAADFRVLREMHREASRQGAAPRPSRRAWIAAAAAALAAVLLTPLVLRERPDGVRGTAVATVPADGAVLATPPAALEWPAEPGARGYHVKLHRADASLLWETDSAAPPAALPPAVRDGMRAGDSWYWTVEAAGPVQRRRLGPFWFRLR
jgi:hypothetical protein